MRGSIVNRGPGRWAIIVDGKVVVDPVTGKRRHKQQWITFRGSKEKAKEKRDALLHARRSGTYVEASSLTVLEHLRAWLEKSVKPPMRRPQTYRTYASLVENHVAKSALADLPLQELRGSDIERYLADLKASPATVKVHHAIFHRALKRAVKDHLLTVNAASGAEFAREAEDHADVREHCWSLLEAQRFLAAAREAGPQAASFFFLALDTGARKSELFGLTWDRVDLDGGRIMIERQLDSTGVKPTYAPVFGPTKTKHVRKVDLGSETVDLLKAHKRAQIELKFKNQKNYQDHGLVFAKEDADLQTPQAKLGQAMNTLTGARFKKIIKAAGVKRIKPHGMRHTVATLSLQAGTPPHVVAARLGHSVMELMKTYAHALPDQNQAAAQTLGLVLHGRG